MIVKFLIHDFMFGTITILIVLFLRENWLLLTLLNSFSHVIIYLKNYLSFLLFTAFFVVVYGRTISYFLFITYVWLLRSTQSIFVRTISTKLFLSVWGNAFLIIFCWAYIWLKGLILNAWLIQLSIRNLFSKEGAVIRFFFEELLLEYVKQIFAFNFAIETILTMKIRLEIFSSVQPFTFGFKFTIRFAFGYRVVYA